jgi:hypothetical protein
VTFDDRQIGSAALSPDGSQIIYEMNNPDPLKLTRSIYLMDRSGENRREIARGEGISTSPEFSPDGKWILFLSKSESARNDSTGLYLLETQSLGSPRFICRALRYQWLNNKEFMVSTPARTLRMSVDGPGATQFYQDSTFAFPILKGGYVLYGDLHKNRQGMWIDPSPGPRSVPSKPRRILSFTDPFAIGHDGSFILVIKDVGEIWRMKLPDGKQERIPATFPGASLASSLSISNDEKEIVYIDSRISAKLVMIENLH